MKVLACCCTGPGRWCGHAHCEACLRPQLGARTATVGSASCWEVWESSVLPGILGVFGAFRSLVKGGVPFQYMFHLPLYSCLSSHVLPVAQGGRMERRLLLCYFPCASTMGSTPAVKAAPVPYLGTCEPSSLDFIPLCLCI